MSESGVAICATILGVAGTPRFFACSCTQPPHRTCLCSAHALACMCSQSVVIWQEQCLHSRRHDLDELEETVGVEVHEDRGRPRTPMREQAYHE